MHMQPDSNTYVCTCARCDTDDMLAGTSKLWLINLPDVVCNCDCVDRFNGFNGLLPWC